ncbi:MAG: hypothetical protein AB1Z22_00590 [Synechococcaceae cyanobacterium]
MVNDIGIQLDREHQDPACELAARLRIAELLPALNGDLHRTRNLASQALQDRDNRFGGGHPNTFLLRNLIVQLAQSRDCDPASALDALRCRSPGASGLPTQPPRLQRGGWLGEAAPVAVGPAIAAGAINTCFNLLEIRACRLRAQQTMTPSPP